MAEQPEDITPTEKPTTVKQAIEKLKALWGGDLEKIVVKDWVSSFEKVPVETAGRAVILERLELIRMTPDKEERRKKTEEFVQDCFDILDPDTIVKDSPSLKRFMQPMVLRNLAEKTGDVEFSPTILQDRHDALSSAESTQGWAHGGKMLAGALSAALTIGGAAHIVKKAVRPAANKPVITLTDGRTIGPAAPINEGQSALFLFLFAALSATAIPLSKIFEDHAAADQMAVKLVSAIDGLAERELGKAQATPSRA